MRALEIHAEDQYAIVPAEMTLAALESSLPTSLHYRAPSLELNVGDWVLSGGVGVLEASPTRRDVLGLTYRSNSGAVEVGGQVVKNVSGYDLVRLIVASDPALERRISLETLTLRLRPRPALTRRELGVSEPDLEAVFDELRSNGAAFGLAYRLEPGIWRVRGEWWNASPAWGEPVSDPIPAGATLRDALGAFPRAARVTGDLETRILAAL